MPILAVDTVVAAIRSCSVSAQRLVVAIDGRSGSGKSTVAEAVAQVIGAVIVPCDDFFAASVSNAEWDRRTPEQRATDAIDVLDLTVLVEAAPATREARLAAREAPDFLGQWHARWDLAEEHYFGNVRPPSAFDVVLQTDGVAA